MKNNQIVQFMNTKNGKYVSEQAIIKALQRKKPSEKDEDIRARYVKVEPRNIPEGMIINPISNRVVQNTSVLRKKLLQNEQAVPVPENKVLNPITNRIVKKTKKNLKKIEKIVPEFLQNLNNHYEEFKNMKKEKKTYAYMNELKNIQKTKFDINEFDITSPNFLRKLKFYLYDVLSLNNKSGYSFDVKSLLFEGRAHNFRWYPENVLKFFEDLITEKDNYTSKSVDSKVLKRTYFQQFSLNVIGQISGGCNKKAERLTREITINLPLTKVELVLENPMVMNKQCGYMSIRKILSKYYPEDVKFPSCSNLYKELKFEKECELTVSQLRQLYELTIKKIGPSLYPLHELDIVLDYQTSEFVDSLLNDHEKIIVCDSNGSNHFYALRSYTVSNLEQPSKNGEKKKKKHFFTATYDYEARTEDDYTGLVGKAKTKKMMPTILGINFDKVGQFKKRTCLSKVYESTPEKSCTRQFIEFLNDSKNNFRFYAHYGSRFDVMLLLNGFTDEEYKRCEIFRIGTRISKLTYRVNDEIEHQFLDSADHLAGSLDKLCSDFNLTNRKQTSFELHGKVMSNHELCFYKKELKFWDFMNLKNTDPEYWSKYVEYCEYDVKSLYELLHVYKRTCQEITNRVANIRKKDGSIFSSDVIKQYGQIDTKLTVCSGAKSLWEARFEQENRYLYPKVSQFLGYVSPKENNSESLVNVEQKLLDSIAKEKFARKALFGGISAVQFAGKYFESLCDADLTSQYPCAMMYTLVPTGESCFYSAEDIRKMGRNFSIYRFYGFYKLKNVAWSESCPRFKIIPKSVDGESYDWFFTGNYDEMCVDSQLLCYLFMKGWIKSYEIEEALLSEYYTVGSKISGGYLNEMFSIKSEQDMYKKSKLEEERKKYNEALRTMSKLCMNSVYGKMIEDFNKYTTISLTDSGKESEKFKKYILLNGKRVAVEQAEKSINPYVPYGVFTLSFSKIMLFEYFSCLPNGTDDVLACETDGWLFKSSLRPQFEENLKNYKFKIDPRYESKVVMESCYYKNFKKSLEEILKVGKTLGGIEYKATNTVGPSYIVMKKSYYYVNADEKFDSKKHSEVDKVSINCVDYVITSKMKGIPCVATNSEGHKYRLVKEEDYDLLIQGGKRDFEFLTLKRKMDTSFEILQYEMKRTVKMKKLN